MRCDRVQADVSRSMDEAFVLPPESGRHLSTCAQCAEFREKAADVGRRYRRVVRAGIDRLRPQQRFPVRRKLSWLIPLAAALLVCWGVPAPAPQPPAVAQARPLPAPPVRIWPVDEEVSFISVPDLLPVRLGDEFWPAETEIDLPRSLRF